MAAAKKDNVRVSEYSGYANGVVEEGELGLLVLPVCDGPPVVIRTHEPYSVRRQQFKVRKKKTPPVAPAPRPDDAATTLVAASISAPLPTPGSLNPPEMTYSVAGEYLYVCPAVTKTGGTAKLIPAANPDQTGIQNAGYPGTGRPFDYSVIDQAAFNTGWSADPLSLAVVSDAQIATGQWEWAFACTPSFVFDPTLS